MNKKVTIIIPVYNIEKYIRNSVESVLAQTYSNLDIILVDDGSTDGCAAICDEYASKDNRIRVIHKENGGASDARNAGFSLADGDYLYFLDGDDYIKNDAIEKLVNAIDREKADIVCFEWKAIYEDFNDPDYKQDFVRKNSYDPAKGIMMFKSQLEHNEFFVSIPLQFFSYSFFKKHGFVFKKGIMHEDELFSPIAFIRAERVVCLHEQLYYRRLRANSVLSDKVSIRSVQSLIVCVDGLVNELLIYRKQSDEFILLRKYVQILLYNIYYYYYKLNQSEKKEISSSIRSMKHELSKTNYLGSVKIFLKMNASVIVHIYNVLIHKNMK